MVDRYYRKIEDIENDIENAMQISSILLKLKGYDDDLGKIDTNEGNISSNLEKINDNENSISNNLEKIDNFTQYILKSAKDFERTYNIEKQISRFNKNNHFYTIFEKEIEHEFIKNSLLFVKNNIHYKYDNLSNDYHRTQHEYNIYDDKDNLIHKYLFNKDVYYDENSDPILNTTEDFCICFKKNYKKIKLNLQLHRHNRHGVGNINLDIDDDNENYIKIDYIEKGISDNSDLISTNTADIASNSGLISTNAETISDNSDLISTNAEAISDNSDLMNTNAEAISDNSDLINTNTADIASNSGLISTNTSSIASNLEKINDLQNSNIKAFYNLDQIFIFDINKGYQTVDKNNHYHIFEKEIMYDFTKNSYLEIILKVLTEVSNYVLIGYFQILCNFYDQNNNLFYTISLSTAAGSINKLSTVKSVFIVPINENMSKIRIDFFIAPKESQQNRSAKFIIQDINSNKIYIKYFQKTDEMSIKNIQDSLNTVNSITSKLYLKNLFNELYHDNDISIEHIFFEKIYTINVKRNDFIEAYFKLLIKYDDVSNSKHITTNFILYGDDIELNSYSYDNSDYISNSNIDILLQNAFSYHFNKDVNKLKIIISFTKRRSYDKISYSSINSNRLIIKHYGN